MTEEGKKALLGATLTSQLGAIIRAAFGVERDTIPRFVGKGVMTSDGFIMANFIDRNGIGHMGAFVGSREDFTRNVTGVAEHCKLSAADRAVFFALMNDWCGAACQSSRRVV